MSAPEAEILFANEAYYTAFANGDVDAMDAIWAHATPVTCIHPGGPVIEGRDAVMESWVDILISGQTEGFECHDAKAHVVGDGGGGEVGSWAWVTCLEVLGDGALATTNIFVRENGAWKITHHQACPTSARPQDTDDDARTPPKRLH